MSKLRIARAYKQNKIFIARFERGKKKHRTFINIYKFEHL